MPRRPKVMRARSRLCREIAEDVLDYLKEGKHLHLPLLIDVTAVGRVVESKLPLTYAEADAEWQATKADEITAAKSGPTILDLLRQALGYDASVSLKGTIEGAIKLATLAKPALEAALAYDRRIRGEAKFGEQVVGTADYNDLDRLYEDWITKAQQALGGDSCKRSESTAALKDVSSSASQPRPASLPASPPPGGGTRSGAGPAT